MAKLPDHLEEIQRQERQLTREEDNDPKFWMKLYRSLDEDSVSLGDLFKAVKRLLLLRVEWCKQKQFEEEEHG